MIASWAVVDDDEVDYDDDNNNKDEIDEPYSLRWCLIDELLLRVKHVRHIDGFLFDVLQLRH